MNLFTESGLKEQIIDAITEIGYENPTEIQKLVIPFLLRNKQDLIALAQTGTGKTAAFGLPLLNQIDQHKTYTQLLILCPTRELCLQITRDIKNYGSKIEKIRSLAVYGGTSISDQINNLKKQPQIIIGTPGRVNDMLRRKVMNLSKIRWLVLDEADEMLSMGFKDELESILSVTAKEKQILLFSATMNYSVEKIAKGYMNNPHKIAISVVDSNKNNISHSYCLTKYNQKLQVLHRILDANPNNYTIIFCRTRIETQQVSNYLNLQKFLADALHGDLSQNQRDNVMKKFRSKNLNILVATDVAARGLDVNNLTHVFHFSLPDDPEIFIHRSGRTGRAGKSGKSISLIKLEEQKKIKLIENTCSIKINKISIPSNEEIIKIQTHNIINKLVSYEIEKSNFSIQIPDDLSKITKEKLFEKFIYFYLNNLINYYSNNPTIIYNEKFSSIYNKKNNKSLSKLRGNRKKIDRKINNNYAQFLINLGKNDKFSKIDIFGLINKYNKGTRIKIGKIDIKDKVTFFEADIKSKYEILNKINNNFFKGKNINIKERH